MYTNVLYVLAHVRIFIHSLTKTVLFAHNNREEEERERERGGGGGGMEGKRREIYRLPVKDGERKVGRSRREERGE